MTLELLIVSGSQAKRALAQGILDPSILKTLGFCRSVSFESLAEREAFLRGFNLAQKLSNPEIQVLEGR